MNINKLTLYNYGFYYKENTFDFNTNNAENNIILIGGANGAGKSTLLESIKIALYGSLYLGYKSNTDEYKSFISDMINYNIKNNQNNKMYIILNIDITRGGNLINYKIKREWNTFSLEENLIIKENDEYLNDEEKDNLINYIRKVYPPSLFDFFLFDGEKISNKLYSQDFQHTLKSIFTKIFNLSLLGTLKDDINNVLSRKTNNSSFDENENEYIEIKNTFENINKKINNKEEIKAETLNEISTLKSKYNKLQQEFELNGGKLAEERTSLNKNISQLEEKKKNYQEEIKELNETLLPFIININILDNALNQILSEREYLNYNNLSKKINQSKIKNKIHNEIKSELAINSLNENITNNILDIIDSTLKPNLDYNNFKVIHKISPGEEDKLKNQIYDLKSINKSQLIDKIKDISTINKKINHNRNLLKENKMNSDLKNLLNDMEEINNKISDLEIKIEELNFDLESLYNKKEEIQQKKDKSYKELVKSKKEESIPVICDKLETVINKYTNNKTKSKIKKLENEFLRVINNLFSVNNYITDINIDYKTFNIKIYNNKKELKSLSSGEQQLVILALLWSLINLSKEKLPIVFDTLFGRIDSKHRKNIIDNLINTTNEQIIVLATDSEINSNFYNEIKPYLVKEYLLSKENKLSHKASIHEKKYFYEGVKNG